MTRDATAVRALDAAPGCALCGETGARRLFEKGGFDFVRCTGCGLVSLRPLPTPAALAAHHEASYRAGNYAAFAAAEGVRAAIARRRLGAIRSLAPRGPWLDVGCSTGTFLDAAVRAGLPAEGLELSSIAVAEARARGLTVHEGSVEGFEPEGRFAVVTAFDVIAHLPDPAGFARRVRAWLVPGGLLALTLPNVASLTARLMARHWFYYAAPDHVHYFTPTTIRRLLAESGFRDVRVRAARKTLTLDYAAAQAARMTPPLAPLVRAVVRLLPAPVRARPLPLPLGEMLVTARPEPREP
jgi:2-polyprenyl-3-methyl-5-hydroxy-6-metoxy-1,4-benzoquinol methylase